MFNLKKFLILFSSSVYVISASENNFDCGKIYEFKINSGVFIQKENDEYTHSGYYNINIEHQNFPFKMKYFDEKYGSHSYNYQDNSININISKLKSILEYIKPTDDLITLPIYISITPYKHILGMGERECNLAIFADLKIKKTAEGYATESVVTRKNF